MGPFRDEHEASHARIAQLEKEKEDLEFRNRELENQLKEKRAELRPLLLARLAILSTLVLGFVGATAVFVGTMGRTCSETRDDPSSFRGIMIGPRSSAHSPHPVLDKVPSPFEQPPKPQDAGACVCAQGDPLCSCL